MRRISIALMLTIVLLTALVIAAIWTQIVPKYRAEGEVQIRPFIPRLVFDTDDNGEIPFYEEFVNTQVSIMRSLVVLNRALDQPEVQATQWFTNPKQSLVQRLRGQTKTRVDRLRESLIAKPRSNTEIMDVSFTAPSAEDAAVVVNAVLRQYIIYVNQESGQTADTLYKILVEQYSLLKNEVSMQEHICARLSEKLRTADPAELIAARRIRLDEAESRVESLKQSVVLLELQVNSTNADPNTDSASDMAIDTAGAQCVPDYYFSDLEWRRLYRRVRAFQHQIANSPLTPKHPDMIRMVKDLEFAEELLRLHEAQLDQMWRNRSDTPDAILPPTTRIGAIDPAEKSLSIEAQLSRARRELELAQADYERQREAFTELFDTVQQLEKVTAELEHKRELFHAVRRRKEEKDMERNLERNKSALGSIRIMTKAVTPSEPHNDRRLLFTAIAAGLCLVLSGSTVFLK